MILSYDSSRRYRRRARERRRRSFTVFFLLIAAFFAGYWLGGEVVRSSEIAYKQRAQELEKSKDRLESQVTELRAKVQETGLRYQQLEERYQSEVPTGALSNLTRLVEQQLRDGISEERLSFVITAARPPRNCASPVTKRFIVPTPAYKGADNAVSFADGAITITGEGESVIAENGQPEAWFDPGKPVKIRFVQLGGGETVKEQLLPVHHSMVVDGREHRFTVAKGPRSFVTVTADHCDYP